MINTTLEMEQDKINTKPVKFVLWLFVLSSIMLFAGLTSAYIVRKAEGNWKIFDLPGTFWVTTVIIVISSITMHYSYLSAKKFNLARQKAGLWLTLILGILFLVGQVYSWKLLVQNNIHFSFANPSESFLYVISGLHAVHIT